MEEHAGDNNVREKRTGRRHAAVSQVRLSFHNTSTPAPCIVPFMQVELLEEPEPMQIVRTTVNQSAIELAFLKVWANWTFFQTFALFKL
jgi:hypothetical protein